MFENYEMEPRGKTMVLENTEKRKELNTTKVMDNGISQNLYWLWKKKKMKPISKICPFTAGRVIRSVEPNVILTCFPSQGIEIEAIFKVHNGYFIVFLCTFIQ